ncbi:RagB/SusD family nutrient uptake outer membrane protein [Dawidia soli]|uniref:RagB/SusD family nutrient uptake outer membrane protein n=1 Tax=Dawidia soli TaxID=2782352 RepID=A0AAP2DAP0_9BACT|nr:RagB/SusD family nutrient uptake outer membrane protein [Dawidia soli]MBT1687611.1 RagB/SusD family nutrient uptake outer membrane protein [Dawidia soli]
MKITKLLYLPFLALAWMGIASCSDDILDLKPLDSFSEVDVFADKALLTDFVNGTYRGMRHPFAENNTFLLLDAMTDNAYSQHGDQQPIRNYTQGLITRDNGESANLGTWNNAYTYIRRVNLFLEKTTDSPIEAEALAQLTGEMQFIRAYLYMELLSWYGGVPIITSTFDLGQADYDVARNSAEEVAAFIVAECDAAVEKLGGVTTTPVGRATMEAAMAVKARTLLYIASPLYNPSQEQSRWIAARDANKAVKELPGFQMIGAGDQYGEMFNGRSTAEIIFARRFTVNNPHGGGSWGVNLWLYSNGLGGWSNNTPTQNLVDSYEMTNGLLPAEAGSGYDPQNPYINRDPRFAESILYNGAVIADPINGGTRDMQFWTAPEGQPQGKDSPNGPSGANASRTGYNFRKFLDEGKKADAAGADENLSPWIYFRITEFYLNYAEAEIALNNEEAARTAINAVRDRVGMPDVVESGAALVERYRNERRVELALENHRFFDIRRWEIGPEALNKPAMGVNVTKDAGGNITYDYSRTADATRHWEEKMYFFPIPYSEIQRSHNQLSQNPGYETN